MKANTGRYQENFVLTELELEATPPSMSVDIRTSEAEICWVSHPNRVYQVEYRSRLTTDRWMPLFTNVVGNGASVCVYHKIVQGEPQKFYRVFAENLTQ
jgi:hypothetical protein